MGRVREMSRKALHWKTEKRLTAGNRSENGQRSEPHHSQVSSWTSSTDVNGELVRNRLSPQTCEREPAF